MRQAASATVRVRRRPSPNDAHRLGQTDGHEHAELVPGYGCAPRRQLADPKHLCARVVTSKRSAWRADCWRGGRAQTRVSQAAST
jgi:hypothetical protein